MMGLFVGREGELGELLGLLASSDEGVLVDVVGIHGIGKTRFLERLRDEARKLADVAVFEADMSESALGEGFRDDYGPNASAAVLWETFARSRQLMLRFATQTGARAFQAFRQECRGQGSLVERFIASNDVHVGKGAQIGTAEFKSDINVTDAAIKDNIRRSQTAVDDAFVDAWTEWSVRRRVLITIDSFDQVADDELGHWFARFALRLPKTVVVLARVPSPESLLAGTDRFHHRPLPPLSPDEVHTYLNTYLNHQVQPGVVGQEITEIVHDFTSGHPGGVMLASNLLNETGPERLQPSLLRRTLNHLPDEPEERWAGLVHLILEAVQDPSLKVAVNACAAVHSFDAPLLGELLTEGDGPPPDVAGVIRALRGHGIVERTGSASEEPSGRYRLPEFIRQSLSRDLKTVDEQRWLELHRRAAQHYFRLLQQTEDGPSDTYGSWYRYESPDWQARKREWLYHSGQLPEKRELTRARFVLVFLEAFWWWGCYHPFLFTRSLLEDWWRFGFVQAPRAGVLAARSAQSSADEQLVGALTVLLDRYPTGHVKTGAPWEEIRQALLLVQRLCGLGRGARVDPSREEDLDRARVAAMIKIFLAHTWRFADPHDTRADRYYGEALAAFEQFEDDWTVSWILFEQADLALERGRAAEAVDLAGRSARRLYYLTSAEDDWDEELVANLYRAVADAHWMGGELPGAMRAYGRAMFHAYRFQGRPHPPDEYSQRFYAEIVERVAGRLGELRGRPVAELLGLVAELRRALPGDQAGGEEDLRAMLERGDVAAVCGRLFPRGPDAGELGSEDSAFMNDWLLFDEEAPDTKPDVEALLPASQASGR